MEIKRLQLVNFRNYEAATLEAAPGVNLIVGENAQGKTNLLESLVYLSTGRSFRTQRGAELVRFGAEFARMDCTVFSQEREQTMGAVIFPDRRPRQLFLNGVKKKTSSELSAVIQSVLFCPEDLQILRSGAAARRRLADAGLCPLRPNYDAALSEYNRVLEQKSRVLKDRFENPALLDLLPVYNTRLIQVGALLISYRARYFQGLSREAAVFHQAFSGGREAFSLTYHTVKTVSDPFAPLEILRDQLAAHMQAHERAELETAQCLSGPHKDDFDVALSGIDLKSYGSQGQTRTAVISLKLAQRELMRRESGEYPILLLDDVLSELDGQRQDFVLNQIKKGQVFITCCEPGRFTRLGQTVAVEHGTIRSNEPTLGGDYV